jgi:hypothetical protein
VRSESSAPRQGKKSVQFLKRNQLSEKARKAEIRRARLSECL